MAANHIVGLTSPTIDFLVHFGAGRCSELDHYLAREPKQLILVEADPDLAESLTRRTADLSQVQVICAAVADQSAQGTLRRYNLPDASSLRAATRLYALYPGLKLLDELPVETVRADALLERLPYTDDQNNVLVIEVPGEEQAVLNTLLEADLLHRFREMQLHCGCESLYAESAPAERVLHWLRDVGFELVAEDDSRDPDRPVWTLQRSTLMLRNRELRHAVEQLELIKAECEVLATTRQKEIEKLQRSEAELSRLEKEWRSAFESLSEENGKINKSAAALQQQIGNLTQAYEKQDKVISELNGKIEKLNQDRNKDRGSLAESRQQLADKTIVLEDQKKRVTELKRQLEQKVQFMDELNANLSAMEKLRDDAISLARDGKAELEALSKVRDDQARRLVVVEGQLKQLTEQRNDALRELDSARKRVDEVELQLTEQGQRQRHIDDEFARAEAQIELLKEILIREQSLYVKDDYLGN